MKKIILCLFLAVGLSAQAQQVAPAQSKSKKENVVLKKDGTPDKRYSSSKKLKKDGTPDKRYKENQKKK